MDYRVELDGKPITIPHEKFLAWNEDAAAKYQTTKNPEARGRLAEAQEAERLVRQAAKVRDMLERAAKEARKPRVGYWNRGRFTGKW